MRYECDLGSNLFWASSENNEFITADLQAGKSYIVIVDVIVGTLKVRVGLAPLDFNNNEVWERVKKLVNKEEQVKFSEEEIGKTNKKLSKLISEMLEKYKSKWKNKKNFNHLDQPIPEDKLTE